jgi:hypothetical protein
METQTNEIEAKECRGCNTTCGYCNHNLHACGCGGRCATDRDVKHLQLIRKGGK